MNLASELLKFYARVPQGTEVVKLRCTNCDGGTLHIRHKDGTDRLVGQTCSCTMEVIAKGLRADQEMSREGTNPGGEDDEDEDENKDTDKPQANQVRVSPSSGITRPRLIKNLPITSSTGQQKTKGRFVMLPHDVLVSEAFLKLSHAAVHLLVDLLMFYNGTNNGGLFLAPSKLALRGWRSRDTVHRVRKELVQSGLVVQTSQGGPGHCATFAVMFHKSNVASKKTKRRKKHV